MDVVLLGSLEHGPAADEAIELLRMTDAAAHIVVHLPNLSVADAVRFTKLGAFSCVSSTSVATGELQKLLRSMAAVTAAVDACPADATTEPWRALLVGNSRAMQKVVETIRLVAPRRCTVLITGETGTGKEVVARSIHMESDRRDHPMVAVNCGAIPAALIEAELFGHVKGAYTGATANRMGLFEQANGGTIFLDEIGELPLKFNPSCCAFYRSASFSGWAARKR